VTTAAKIAFVVRLAGDLLLGEAQRNESGCRVGLIAAPVLCLLRGRSVIAEPVGLHDQAELGPVEVDAEAVHVALRQWRGQARTARDRKETALELGVGEGEGVAVEQTAERGDAALSCAPFERRAEAVGIDQVELVGLVGGGLELVRREALREIKQRAHDTRERDAVAVRDVGFGERPAVDADARPLPLRPRNRHVYRPSSLLVNAIDLARGVMTERSARPAAENGSNEDPMPRELRPADGVDAAMDRVQLAPADSVVDRARAEPQVEQLASCHHAMLLRSQPEHFRERDLLTFPTHRWGKSAKR